MARDTKGIPVYLEVGEKRTFAGALQWPGWCRVGRDEESALRALVQYARRYAKVVHGGHLKFQAPDDIAAFEVVERVKGDSSTDFGAPGGVPKWDTQPLDDEEHERLRAILRASWRALDAAAKAAEGKGLRKGPRGGGRDTEKIVRHVLGADQGYLRRLAHKVEAIDGEALDAELARTREVIFEALAAGARGEIPEKGPRGGAMWPPRYFVRRSVWHVLDHAWEIEDRIE